MTVVQTMQAMLSELSKNERKVAEHFIAHPYDAQRVGADGAAELCRVSRSTLIRFCQKLGFKGYSEFRYTLMSQQLAPDMGALGAQETSSVAERYLACYEQMATTLSPAALDRATDLIYRSQRVICLGILHSGMSASQMAFRLNRIGIDAQAISDNTVMDSYTRIASTADTVVVFSITGRSEYPELLEGYRKARSSIILITMAADAPAARLADEVVVLPSALRESHGHILDEAPIFFFAIELLIEAVSHKMAPMEME